MMIRTDKKNLISLLTFCGVAVIILLVNLLALHPGNSYFPSLIDALLLIAGLWFIRSTLLFFVSDLITSFTLVIIVFATNLFDLSSADHLLQPVMIFLFFALVMYFTASAYYSYNLLKTIALAVFSGITILIHPTGYLVLLIPALWGIHDKESGKQKVSLVLKNRKHTIIFLSSLFLMILILIVILKINPGEISFLGFQLPGVFYLNFRYLWNNLFSFDHGWLIYSPVMLLPAIGFYLLAERNKEIFFSFFIICLVEILVESCWSSLDSTVVFGQVAFVPLIALLSLPIAVFFRIIAGKNIVLRVFTGIICIFFIVLNIFQTWQYQNGIILKSGMTYEFYDVVFGRTNLTEIEKQRMTGVEPDVSSILKDGSEFNHRFIAFYDFEDTTAGYKSQLESEYHKSGNYAFKLDSTGPFSPALKIPYAELTSKKEVVGRITVSVFSPANAPFPGGDLVFSSIHDGITFGYKVLNLGSLNLRAGEWHTETLDYLFPAEHSPGDLLAAYVWYNGKFALFIDDLKFELFETKK